MIAVFAAAIVTTSAHMSVDGFLRFRAGDAAWIDGKGEIDVPAGKEGAVLRFEATSGRDVMSRWVVVEPGHSYRVERSACAGIAFRDLAQPRRRPFVQVSAHVLGEAAFPLKVLGHDGAELDEITWADIGHTTEASLDPKCPDLGARVRVVDAKGGVLLDQRIVVPNERVTRVILQPGGGFSAEAYDAHYIYLREDARRVDPVEVNGVRIVGKPYGVRHTHGGAGAKVGQVMFEATNTSKAPRVITPKKVEMLREHGGQPATLSGIGFAKDEDRWSEGDEEPAKSVTLAAGETRFLRVWVHVIEVYLASINSTHRWSVDFDVSGEAATATVPLEVTRMEPYRPRGGDDGE